LTADEEEEEVVDEDLTDAPRAQCTSDPELARKVRPGPNGGCSNNNRSDDEEGSSAWMAHPFGQEARGSSD